MANPIAPGHQAVTQETPRVLTRGKLEFFVYDFFYDAGKTQPVMPLDPQQYPSYKITGPDGGLVAQGVGLAAGSPGRWRIGWVVPKNAELTNPNRRYTFQSVMVDEQLRQFEVSFHFDMVESNVPAQVPENQQLLTLVGQPIRLFFKNTIRPSFLNVRVTPRASDKRILHLAKFVYPIPEPALSTNILEIENENQTGYTYYIDTVPFAAAGSYSAVWSVRDTVTSQLDFEHQIVEVVTTSIMHDVKSVRMLIDKLQKKLGIVYAYKNEDIIEYIHRGTELVNAYWPPTDYTATNYPSAFGSFVVMASAWWGLMAQRILYAETNFEFSGQTVTLGYNPGADIDGIISQLREYLDATVGKTKKAILRQGQGVGAVSVRPYQNRHQPVVTLGQTRGPHVAPYAMNDFYLSLGLDLT